MKNPFAPFFAEVAEVKAAAIDFVDRAPPAPPVPAEPAYARIQSFIDKAVSTLDARRLVLVTEIEVRTNELYHTNLTIDGLKNAVATIFDNAAEDAIIADLSEGIEEKSAAEIAAMFAPRVDYDTPNAGEDLCIDEGCEHHGTDHVCIAPTPERTADLPAEYAERMKASYAETGRPVDIANAVSRAKAPSLLREDTAAPSDTTPKYKTWYIGEIIDARTYNALPPKYRPTVGPWTDTPRGGTATVTATVTAVSPKFKPDSFA